MSFASCNKWQLLESSEEQMRGTIQGGEWERYGEVLVHCRLLSVYPFVLLSLLTFMGRSKGRDVTASVPVSFFFVDPLGAIVVLKFKCRKLFSVDCKRRL